MFFMKLLFEEIASFISQVGFPIFVAIFVLVKLNRVLSRINKTLIKICDLLEITMDDN